MPSQRAEFSGRALRWVWPAALLALAPKCLLCTAAYVGLGAALGLGGPELCGAPGGPSALAILVSALAWIGGAALVVGAGGACVVCRAVPTATNGEAQHD